MRGERLKGHLDLLLLAAVAAGESHGYAIVKRLRDQSFGLLDLKEGTLYPALHRIESSGLVQSRWAEAGAAAAASTPSRPRDRTRCPGNARNGAPSPARSRR